jgi:hypothetical protein
LLFQIKFARPIKVYDDKIECRYTIRVSRRGIGSMTLGYVFTDYFAQGCTWGDIAFFLHLLTSDNNYKAGNLRVPITRASSIEGVKLLSPLWTDEQSRLAFKAKLTSALKPDIDYVAEIKRLRELDGKTRLRFSEEWAECEAFVASVRAAVTTITSKRPREEREPLGGKRR